MIRLSGLSCAIVALFVVGSCGATPRLLGRKECTFGPTYWCQNFQQAQKCNAFSHCMQTVWEKHVYPVDNDEICKICLDMVTQARDQLRSNETLEDLKAVFEGSCALIPLKLVRKECDKMVDNFIPELVEALSSEMDPTAVCSVAGLCNNKEIDRMLLEHHDQEYQQRYGDFDCKSCEKIGQVMVDKFERATEMDVLESLLHGCRYMGSYSDSCASLAHLHYERLFHVLKDRLSVDNICHLSGACYLKFHHHEVTKSSEEEEGGLEVRSMAELGLIRPEDDQEMMGDDVPCELCKQLVVHLRDIVISNTSEAEFEQVLRAICTELKFAKSECESIAADAKMIYDMISKSLDPALICGVINICPSYSKPRLIMPLLALEPAKIAMSLRKKESFTKEEVDAFQLPFDTLMGPQNANELVQKGEVCTLCEMILHFVQQSMAEEATEQQIKETVERVCTVLPSSVRAECDNFVINYGDAVIAMLIQEIDPNIVCPMMKMCSQRVKMDVEIFETKPMMHVEIESKDKPTCPLCLFAVTEAKTRIQSDKSIENIKHTLETLCTHLPKKLNMECEDFVDSYAKMLVDMLVKDMSPQDICVKLQLCTQTRDNAVPKFIGESVENEMDNEIPDNTYNGRVVVMGHSKSKGSGSTPECLVCQHMVKELEKELDSHKTREQIKKILDHVCDKVKQELKGKCIAFMAKHEEQIIDLVMKGTEPKEICIALGFCAFGRAVRGPAEFMEDFMEQMFNPVVDDLEVDEAFSIDFISLPAGPSSMGRIQLLNREPEEEKPKKKVTANEGCIMCEFIMTKLEADLNKKSTQEDIRKAVDNVCTVMPKSVRSPCTKFVDNYAEMIITLLATTPPAQICQKIKMCTPPKVVEEVVQLANNDVLECAICQGAVTIIDRLLEDEDFDKNLEQVVEKTCAAAPRLYKNKCAELVRSYGPSIINMLLAKAQPEKVCEELSLCFPNEYSTFVQINDDIIPSRIRREAKLRTRRQVALGASKCTWGPSYWCGSLKSAEECNAVDHCLEKRWNGVKPSA